MLHNHNTRYTSIRAHGGQASALAAWPHRHCEKGKELSEVGREVVVHPITCTMRVELFAKDATSLAASARQLVGFGATGLNVPQKSKAETPLLALQALQASLPRASLCNVVPHYSLKFSGAGSAVKTLQAFEDFCTQAHTLQVRELLLVSGSGTRAFDSLALLRAMRLPAECAPRIGVAFNPYFPDEASRERERARLREKIQTGRVTSVWLQIGSDINLLREGLHFVLSLPVERPLRLYGSIFVPSRRLLAQMKFRPWNGVFLSDEYLCGVEAAEAITKAVVAEYHACGVEVLVETALRSEIEWAHAAALMRPPEPSLAAATMPGEDATLALVDETPCASDALANGGGAPASGAKSASNAEGGSNAKSAKSPKSPKSTSKAEGTFSAEGAFSQAEGTDASAARPSKRPRSSTTPRQPHLPAKPNAMAAGTEVDVVVESWESTTDKAEKAGSDASWEGEAVGSSTIPPAVVWYRTFDLRTADHAPLLAAVERPGGGPVIPAFVWPERRGRYSVGGAAQAWLLVALEQLDRDLSTLGSGLVLRAATLSDAATGGEAPAALLARLDPADHAMALAEARGTAAALCRLVGESGATHVYWHKSYEPEGQMIEALVASALRAQMGDEGSVVIEGLPGHLLCEGE